MRIKYSLFSILPLALQLSMFYCAQGYSEEEQQSEPSQSLIKGIKEIPSIKSTEVSLENGLKVIIKATDFDADEVFVQAIASGGYASANKEELASAYIAAKVAKESGLGFHSIHELNYNLYRDSIEFSLEVAPNLRTVEVTGPSKNLDTMLKLVEMVFTKQNLTPKALDVVVAQEKSVLSHRLLDRDTAFEVMYTGLNTQNEPALQSISLKDMDGVTLEKVTEFYRSAFTNPENFNLIVVGDIDVAKTIELIKNYLGPLKNNSSINVPCCLKLPSFPEGIVKRVIPAKTTSDAYGRMTFLLNTKFTSESVFSLEMMTLFIEKRLRDVMMEQTGKANGIDVGYQLPLFPYTKPLWVTITFNAKKKDVAKIEQLIIRTLRNIQNSPISETDFKEIQLNLMSYDEFWQKDNSYWEASLANYLLWDWDLKNLGNLPVHYKSITKEQLFQFIKDSFSTENYTLLVSQP